MLLHGFTLIELLVVITIIVVLLALLTPALDKAIYQAELAVCAADQHGLGLAVVTYTADNRQRYPYRLGVHDQRLWPMNISRPPARYDDRPKLKPYLSLNGTLNCPLSPELDIEGSHADTYTFAAYNLWFGFQYRLGTTERFRGMLRLGDRWEWPYGNAGYIVRSSLLSGTRYIVLGNGNFVSASHPGETYSSVKVQDENLGGVALAGLATVGGAKYTFMRWDSYDLARGAMDLNNMYADLSVLRSAGVDWEERERVARVPEYSNAPGWTVNGPGANWELVPRE